jgi:ABC-type sugar transport system ATPase subunit
MESTSAFLQVEQLTKHFGGVQALKGVDLEILPGEVHGLVGANGAGKSTLIRCLAGVIQPDTGLIQLDGSAVRIPDPQVARQLGLSFIHQELNMVPKFSGLQNMLLGIPKPKRLGLVDWKAARAQVDPVVNRLGITFRMDVPVDELTVAERWMISIGRALLFESRLIAMDEPTASLSAEESERLFRIIRELSAQGIAILYVSHRLDEILDLCSRVTVFKDGARVLSVPRSELSRRSLVRAIVGSDVDPVGALSHAPPQKEVLLEVRGLSRAHYVKGASLALHKGEVLGLAGLVGSGRSELVRMIYGADKPDAGEMLLEGKPLRIRSPYEAVKSGIALVPEERRSQGLLLDKSVAFNVNIPSVQSLRPVGWLPIVNLGKGRTRAQEVVEQLQVKTRSVDTPVRNLSGGNQQKVVIGKWLTEPMKVIILDEPSRGVDVGARGDIHLIVRNLAEEGAGIIVISSEVEELPGLCDRVLVMVEGRIVGELSGGAITKEALLHLSYAHEGNGAQVVHETEKAL